MIKQEKILKELKKEGKTILSFENLESIRKTWFEMGYKKGYTDRDLYELTEKRREDAYYEVRGYPSEERKIKQTTDSSF